MLSEEMFAVNFIVPGCTTVDPVRLVLTEVLCRLHALYAIHRSAHWQVYAEPYYGDHLMFQRLFEVLDDEIDALAERMVYTIGPESVDADLLSNGTAMLVSDWIGAEIDPYERAIKAEQDLVESLERCMHIIEENGGLTQGWDDYLGRVASKHEEHLFLLTARVRSS